jgi:hypothetical protein
MAEGRRWIGSGARLGAIVLAATLLVACAEPSSVGNPTPSPTPSSMSGALPLVRGGAVLHPGTYCRALQQVSPGANALPVANGCLFNLTTAADVFATDGADYAVSEVVGSAQLGVRGPAGARVMIECRLSPRAKFWFWIAADGSWNVSRADDAHHPQDLVGAAQSEPLRQYVATDGSLNDVQFKCAGGATSRAISLALNVNGHQFAALTVPMPATGTPLTRPSTPWYVDLGARLTSDGTLEGTVAKVTLYQHE